MLRGDSRTCNLPENLDDVGSSGNTDGLGDGQGTAVYVHTVTDVEQSNHKPIPPFLQRRLTCGAKSHPL